MNHRGLSAMLALLASMTVASVAMHGHWATEFGPAPAEARVRASHHETADPRTAQSEASKQAPAAGSSGAPSQTPGAAPQVLYDLNSLPAPMQRMLESIIVAAQSGDVENMRPVLESNELKPLVGSNAADDPIELWKKTSSDGQGREVLAAMLNVLSSGFVRTGEGHDAMYVWPYFAVLDLSKLTPSQEVEFYRLVPATEALAMEKAGKYSYYRLAISPEGVWHYFLR